MLPYWCLSFLSTCVVSKQVELVSTVFVSVESIDPWLHVATCPLFMRYESLVLEILYSNSLYVYQRTLNTECTKTTTTFTVHLLIGWHSMYRVTVLRYRRLFFFCVWLSDYACRPMIANVLYPAGTSVAPRPHLKNREMGLHGSTWHVRTYCYIIYWLST